MTSVISNISKGFITSKIFKIKDKKITPSENLITEAMANYFFINFYESSAKILFAKEVSVGMGKQLLISLPMAFFSVVAQKAADDLNDTPHVFLKKSLVCIANAAPLLRNTAMIISSIALVYFGSPVLGLSILGFGVIDLLQKKKWMPKQLHLIANWSGAPFMLLSLGNSPGISPFVSALAKGTAASFSALFLAITAAQIAQSLYFSYYPPKNHPAKDAVLEHVRKLRENILKHISSPELELQDASDLMNEMVLSQQEIYANFSNESIKSETELPHFFYPSPLKHLWNLKKESSLSPIMRSILSFLLGSLTSELCSRELLTDYLAELIEKDPDLRGKIADWLKTEGKTAEEAYIPYYQDLEIKRWVMKKEYISLLLENFID